MATLGAKYQNLADLYKQQDGKGQVVADIIEMLAEVNPILDDAMTMECNDGTKHLTTIRTGLPAGTWRRLYQGVQPTKSTMKQVHDTTGMLEAWSEVDAKLVKLSKNQGQFRLNEAKSFIEGLSQDVANAVFYGNTDTDPEQFMGLAPRFSSTTAENGSQVILAGGSGTDNTSIWFVVWGDRTCHMLYPQGTMAGLQRNDLGEETKENTDGSLYRVFREQFMWDIGLSVRDWRYVVRIANIDVSAMAGGSVALYTFMRKAYYQLQQRRVAGGRVAIYCNRDVMEALDAIAHNQGASDNFIRLRPTEFEGKLIQTYRGIPVRETDALINDEDLVA